MARKIKRQQDPQMIKQLRHLRAIAGLERAEYFRNGGDPKQWRPLRKVAVDKRRHENKNRCRKIVRVFE
jgi:hypothetical protein